MVHFSGVIFRMHSTVLKWRPWYADRCVVELVDLIGFFRAVGNYTAKAALVVLSLWALIACMIPVMAKIESIIVRRHNSGSRVGMLWRGAAKPHNHVSEAHRRITTSGLPAGGCLRVSPSGPQLAAGAGILAGDPPDPRTYVRSPRRRNQAAVLGEVHGFEDVDHRGHPSFLVRVKVLSCLGPQPIWSHAFASFEKAAERFEEVVDYRWPPLPYTAISPEHRSRCSSKVLVET